MTTAPKRATQQYLRARHLVVFAWLVVPPVASVRAQDGEPRPLPVEIGARANETEASEPPRDAPIDLEGTELEPAPDEDSTPLLESPIVEPEEPEVDERRVRFTGFPFVFYIPETSFGFGFGVGVSILTKAPPPGSRFRWYPSNLTAGGAYTLHNQLRFLLTPEIFLARGRVVIDGQTELRLYPDRFYGLGRDTDTQLQHYTDTTFRTSTAIRYQVRPSVYVGAVIDGSRTRISDVADEDTAHQPRPTEPSNQWLGTGGVPGDRSSRVFGLGPTFVLDTRDFTLMSRSGYFLRAVAVGYPLGPYRFARGLLDARMFFPFANGNVVLAAQWVFSAVIGHAPFNHLASVGGPVGLRSFPDGRFRDAMQTFAQVELRFPIVWRFRGAVHFGTGSVFGPNSRGDPARILWAAGVGLRVVLIPERRLAVRGDVVLGPEGMRIIAFVHEAF